MVSEGDWLTEGETSARQHAYEAPLAPPLQEVWDYNAGAGFSLGSPLLLGEMILVATRKGEIHGIEFESGRRRGMKNFGEVVEGTPTVQKGLLYVPVAIGRRVLYAYDLERGQTRWRTLGTPIDAGLLALDDAIVAADVHATVRAYALDDGAVLWEHSLGDKRSVQATPVLAAGLVVAADDAGHVVALRPEDGTAAWTHRLDAPVYNTPAASEETVYLPTTRGRFYALDARTGAERWRFALPDTTVRFTAPAVDADLVVFGASDGMLRAFDARTGVLRWAYADADALTAAPLLTPGWVYVGTMGRNLLAVERATGTLRWSYTLRGRVKSAMAARDGYLVVLSEPRYVYLFKSASVPGDVATQ